MNPSRKAIVGAALLGALVVLPLYAVKTYQKDSYTDFDVYYRTSERMRAGDWPHVYDFERDGNTPFRYSPLTLPLFRPLAYASHKTSREIWYFFQYLCFAAGFAVLLRSLRLLSAGRPDRAALICSLAFFFVVRFCLDAFSIVQISGLTFLALNAALARWLGLDARGYSAAVFVPASLKIVPGVLFGLPFFRGPIQRRPAVATAIALTVALAALSGLLAGSFRNAAFLWTGFWSVTTGDSKFMDASHYGSQSVKSALLGLALSLMSPHAASMIWIAAVLAGTASLFLFWARRRPRDPRAEALFFSLGIFADLLFRPETFKYAMPSLAIPVALLLLQPLDRLEKAAFVFAACVLSLGGLDIVGETAYFFMMKASFPTLAILGLATVTARRAWLESN